MQTRKSKTPPGEYRQQCLKCFRTPELCYCESVGAIDNRTEILILQHRRERMHPFNTARIVDRTLNNSRLICERTDDFAAMSLPIAANAGLLYPGKDAQLLTDLPPESRPDQLVILDGTWHHAKTLFRDIPQLQNLPKYRLAPTQPGQYRIRMEPNETSLSTLEAVAAALEQLEPETANIAALTEAFDCMIEKQLAHPQSNYSGLAVKPKKIPNPNIPKSITQPTGNLVIAYGEAAPVDYKEVSGWAELNQRQSNNDLPPVYWCAHRLSSDERTDERFHCFLDGGRNLADKFYRFMDLSPDDFSDAVSAQDFSTQWNDFIREDDLVLVHNRNAADLLANCGISNRLLTVNSINYDPLKHFDSIEKFVIANDGDLDSPTFKGRAGRRLATVTSLIKVLMKPKTAKE